MRFQRAKTYQVNAVRVDAAPNQPEYVRSISRTLSQLPETEIKDDEAADFEQAIVATGYGKFNILMLLVALPAGWSSAFESSIMSFVFPAAHCDLGLSMADKGSLNAITYIGMVCSAMVWGFLCDTLGRKSLLITGLLLDAIFVFLGGLSQNFILLMVMKFLGGFIINGPFAALSAYLAEFHSSNRRPIMQLIVGITFGMANLFLPAIAWLILPSGIFLHIAGLDLHGWNVLLCVTSLSPLLATVGFAFLPESPKFLMTTGRNEKALQIFRTVYAMNTGKKPETYPIKKLVDENATVPQDIEGEQQVHKRSTVTPNRSKMLALREGWQQLTPLFRSPHISRFVLVCTLQMMVLTSLNTFRLWVPQIFQGMNDYKFQHPNSRGIDMCETIRSLQINATALSEECTVNFNNSSVYVNAIMVYSGTLCGFVIVGFLINKLGKKVTLASLSILAGSSVIGLFFIHNEYGVVVLTCTFVAMVSICVNVVLAVVVDLFPTTLRTMTVALTMMIGRAGAGLGNLVYPLLLQAGCAPPLFSVGIMIISCGLLTILLPNTERKALQ